MKLFDKIIDLINTRNKKKLLKIYCTEKLKKEKYVSYKAMYDFINVSFYPIFNSSLKSFLKVKKELEKIRNSSFIPLSDIFWYKIQIDEFNISASKKMPTCQRLKMLGDVYENRAKVCRFINDKKQSFIHTLQSIHFQIASELEKRQGKIIVFPPFYTPQTTIYYIKDNNISLQKLEELYIEAGKSNKDCGGLYSLYKEEQTFPYALDHIKERLSFYG